MQTSTCCAKPRARAKVGSAVYKEREIAATGIELTQGPLRYYRFGYFIEITKSNLANVPAYYTRKQTTVGGERFITPELRRWKTKVLGAATAPKTSVPPTVPEIARRNLA